MHGFLHVHAHRIDKISMKRLRHLNRKLAASSAPTIVPTTPAATLTIGRGTSPMAPAPTHAQASSSAKDGVTSSTLTSTQATTALSAEDWFPSRSPIMCSTQIQRTIMPIVPVINSAAPSMDSILDTNKGNSFECNQIRYITNTIPECSIGVIRDAEKVFGRMIAQSPPPATLAKGQGPSV